MNLNEQRVREFAYQIWEAEGRPFGHSERHWEMASKLALDEVQPPASSKPKKPRTKAVAEAKPETEVVAPAKKSRAKAVKEPEVSVEALSAAATTPDTKTAPAKKPAKPRKAKTPESESA